jgi:hypothetical protein
MNTPNATMIHGLQPEQIREWIDDSIKKHFKVEPIKDPVEEYMTRKQVCEMLHINASTLWLWTKNGKLASYSIANRVWYRRSDIEAAMVRL